MTAAYTSDELRCGYRVIQVYSRSMTIECTHCGDSFSTERDGDAPAYETEECPECHSILCPLCDAPKCEGCDVRHCAEHLLNWFDEKWCKTCLAEATK